MLTDVSLTEMLFRAAAYLVVAGVHGWSLALAAFALGDLGPRSEGRQTPSPFEHMSLSGFIAAIAVGTGWIHSLDMDAAALRWRRVGLLVCVAGSLAVIVALGLFASALRPAALAAFSPPLDRFSVQFLGVLGQMSLFFVVLNMLPLPPLTGGLLLSAAAPRLAGKLWRYAGWIGAIMAVVLILGRGGFLRPAVSVLRQALTPLGFGPG
ncbi:zinc metalloprotease [Roseitranquillus sediminis]|uniref:hypothetical protein n=1 Tax=Roseitranquillus sediminis TaxID=2809051 RepID=UPI001D0C267E|nr:hypothetical protein [Roseitranquillus sediminis]MBM9595950.1 hypothetical protein [Roseitranquillus sediminis]